VRTVGRLYYSYDLGSSSVLSPSNWHIYSISGKGCDKTNRLQASCHDACSPLHQ
jgi:hypothetical protein